METAKKDIIRELKKSILKLQGFKTVQQEGISFRGLEAIESAFPNSIFPTGAIHEFISPSPEHQAATGGFIAGLLQTLMYKGGICIWVGRNQRVFPLSLKAFGVEPDRIIFVDVNREKDLLWVIEEGLKCEGLAAVVGEIGDIDFPGSRRLQLITEKSGVSGFLLLQNQKPGATACTARWQIRHLQSETEDGLPGVGFPRWEVELLKVRNGSPGRWELEWTAGRFRHIERVSVQEMHDHQLQTG